MVFAFQTLQCDVVRDIPGSPVHMTSEGYVNENDAGIQYNMPSYNVLE